MNSCNYDKVLDMIKNFSNSAKRKLILDISILLKLSSQKDNSNLICPHCHNKYIVKNGKNKNVQRYLCKTCRRSFVRTTNTPIFSTKKDKIECDETFFQESFKGNHKSDGFVMPRKAHKRGGQARFRGISKEKVCVLTALDDDKSLFIAPIAMGKTSSNDLIRSIGKAASPGSTLITDSSFAYKTLSSYCKLNHVAIPKGQHSFKNFNIQKINNLHGNIKRFISVYRGVSTKYLANYLALFKYIFCKIEESPLFIKGSHPYKNTNFKGRPPIFK